MASEKEQKALDHIRRLISLGHHPDGSRLPPERDLAAELDIGRGPVRRALGRLEAEGRITRYVGQGTFVGNRPAPRNIAPAKPSITMTSPHELMEARLAIEPRVAAMAAVRATDGDIEYLRLSVTRSESATDWQTWERWDVTFHRTMALSASNVMLADIIDAMNNLRRVKSRNRVRHAAIAARWLPLLVRQHRAVVEAVVNRDPYRAAEAMSEHLRCVEERLFGNIEDLDQFIAAL